MASMPSLVNLEGLVQVKMLKKMEYGMMRAAALPILKDMGIALWY